MQVSSIQESSTDYRKFYMHNGAKVMRLRAETKCVHHLVSCCGEDTSTRSWVAISCLVLTYGQICIQGGQVGLDNCLEPGKGDASHPIPIYK